MFLLGYAAYYKNHAGRTYYNTSVSSVESFSCVYRLHRWVDMHAYVISADAMRKYSGEITPLAGTLRPPCAPCGSQPLCPVPAALFPTSVTTMHPEVVAPAAPRAV